MKAKPKVYLAGRMSSDPADKEWRDSLTPFLENLGFDVLNPYILEPLQLKGLRPKQLPDGIKHWYDLRKSDDKNHYSRFKRYIRAIIKYDIKLVINKADIVIVRWSPNCASGAGTHSEITYAFMNDKPVYLVEEHEMPTWTEGCIEEKFKTFDDLKSFFTKEFGSEDEDKEPIVQHG